MHAIPWNATVLNRFRRLAVQSGKAEYKSVTVSLDATAEEFTDFYLDDDIRPTWVSGASVASLPAHFCG